MRLLQKRHRQPEIMDQPDLCPVRHAHALAGLARINWMSNSAGILWPALRDLARQRPGGHLRLLDLATGAGDVPLALWRRARRAGFRWEVAGCDISPVAVEQARGRATRAGAPVEFFVHDTLAGPPPGTFDAVVCSLFLHHLDDDQAVALLGVAARLDGVKLLLVNDLRRCLGGLILAHMATRLLTTSRVVHTDGPLSVHAAFTVDEARDLARRAGLQGAVVARRWPFRWLLRWRPS